MNEHFGPWIGIDVSKLKLDVVLLDPRGKLRSKSVSNDARGHATLLVWLQQHQCPLHTTRLCMEATGPYSEAVALALSDAGWHVSVVNPARVKGFASGQMARNKTDQADAALLAQFAQAMKPERWCAPSLAVRELRALVARLQHLQDMHQQEANRLEACNASPQSSEPRASIQEHMLWLDHSIQALRKRIDDHIDGDPDLRRDAELMRSIPGVGPITAAKVLAYLGDVRRFASAKALAAFIGVTPRLRQSGSSVRGRSSIARTGHAMVRHALFFPAMTALRFNPAMLSFGQRLANTGLSRKAIITAAMHKLTLYIYGVLRSGLPFSTKTAMASLDSPDGI
jgi:transposase